MGPYWVLLSPQGSCLILGGCEDEVAEREMTMKERFRVSPGQGSFSFSGSFFIRGIFPQLSQLRLWQMLHCQRQLGPPGFSGKRRGRSGGTTVRTLHLKQEDHRPCQGPGWH